MTTAPTALERAMHYFTGTPAGKAVVEQAERAEAAELQAARAAAAKEIDAITAAETAALKKHEAALAPIQASVQQLEEQLKAARAQRAELVGAYGRTAHALSRRREDLRAELYQTRPAALLAAFNDDLQALLTQATKSHEHVIERAIDGRDYVRWSNRDSVQARSEAILELVRIVRDELPYSVETENELIQRFEKLKSFLPEIEPRPAKWLR